MGEQTIIPPSREETIPPMPPKYGAFVDRLIAFILDNIILTAAKVVLLFPVLIVTFFGGFVAPSLSGASEQMGISPSLWAISLIADWLYFAGMESGRRGATLGKRAMGLRVLTEDGKPLNFRRASFRFAAKFVSYLPLMLGFVMAIFTKKKQALHDLLVETLVVEREP